MFTNDYKLYRGESLVTVKYNYLTRLLKKTISEIIQEICM